MAAGGSIEFDLVGLASSIIAPFLLPIVTSWLQDKVLGGGLSKTEENLSAVQKMRSAQWGPRRDQALISDGIFFYQMNALSLRGFAHSGIRMPKPFEFLRRAEQQSPVQGATGDSVQRRRFAWTEIVVILLLLMAQPLVCVLMAEVDMRLICLGINAVAFWLFAYASSAQHCVALQTNWNHFISLLLAFFILDVCYAPRVSHEPAGWMIAALALAFVFSSTLVGFNMYVKIKPLYRLKEVIGPIAVMLILSLLLAIVLGRFMVSGLTGTPPSIEVLRSPVVVCQ